MSRVSAQEQAGNGKPAREPRVEHGGLAEAPAPERTPPPDSFGRAQPGTEDRKPPLSRRPGFWVVLAIIVIGAVLGGVLWWQHAREYVSTDDAFVQAHVTSISPRVAGHVAQVLVTDNQDVKQGQDLVKLDPRDFQQAVDSAEAQRKVTQGQLESARSQVVAAQASEGQARADVTSAEINAQQAEEDLQRYQSADRRAVSQQQLTVAQAAARSASAALEAARQKLAASQAQVILARAQVATAEAQVDRANVAVEQARTQLGYASIQAPIDGRISNRSVSIGDFVQTGQGLMALVPADKYVIANFKETEVADLRPGQPVAVRVDAYGTTLRAHVQSIQAGSGAAFSLLPAENATGNYVKVVQRVPVKIVFDDPAPANVGPGMSVVPTVDIRNR